MKIYAIHEWTGKTDSIISYHLSKISAENKITALKKDNDNDLTSNTVLKYTIQETEVLE